VKVNKNRRTYILRMLWERKYFYLGGYIVGIICGLLNEALGKHISIEEMIVIPVSTSFPFGYLLYLFIRERSRVIKEGRYLVFSKEGLINFGLAFASMIVLELLYKIIQYSLGIVWRG
jgi:hypothetical protein